MFWFLLFLLPEVTPFFFHLVESYSFKSTVEVHREKLNSGWVAKEGHKVEVTFELGSKF